MPRRQLVSLLEQNILVLHWIGDRMKARASATDAYSVHQLQILMRLFIGGRARLKDIAKREMMPTSNLCNCFKRLETDGLVSREVDKNDRRNTLYSVTKKGENLANRTMEKFRDNVNELFVNIDKEDEVRFVNALKTTNEILNKVKQEHEI